MPAPYSLFLTLFLTWAGLIPAALADDPALVSGPPAGSQLNPIACYAVRGPLAGQEFDAAKQVGQSPAAFLFIHDLSRNTAPVIRELDRLGDEYGILDFHWFPIMLHADRTEGENRLQRVNDSLKLHQPLVLSLDGLEGPGDYALNRRCTLTLVLAKDQEVTQSIALTDTGPADFPKLKAWVESVAGVLPEDEGALRDLLLENLPQEKDALRVLAVDQMLEIRRLRQELAGARAGGRGMRQQRRDRPGMSREGERRQAASPDGDTSPAEGPAERQRQGKPPEDPELNASLRAFIRKTNDEARSDEVFKEISARAAESEDLTAEAVEMFKLMLSFRDRYGTEHAQRLAESFLKEHADPSEN